MGLRYENLDAKGRDLMRAEVERDVAAGSLYVADKLSPGGKASYPQLLKDAAAGGTDDTLAAAILPLLNATMPPRDLGGGRFSKPPKMSVNAHTLLAESEFNRFYIRGVCLRALGLGYTHVIVYRARPSSQPRPESEALIRQPFPAEALLRDLRASSGVETALGLPSVNSGLSVKLP